MYCVLEQLHVLMLSSIKKILKTQIGVELGLNWGLIRYLRVFTVHNLLPPDLQKAHRASSSPGPIRNL